MPHIITTIAPQEYTVTPYPWEVEPEPGAGTKLSVPPSARMALNLVALGRSRGVASGSWASSTFGTTRQRQTAVKVRAANAWKGLPSLKYAEGAPEFG